jgi:hypothetical protein
LNRFKPGGFLGKFSKGQTSIFPTCA